MYDLTFVQNSHFGQKNQPKNHVHFMAHAFSLSKHFFGQCEHFSLVEPFEKP
jgi:hypothetical protein